MQCFTSEYFGIGHLCTMWRDSLSLSMVLTYNDSLFAVIYLLDYGGVHWFNVEFFIEWFFASRFCFSQLSVFLNCSRPCRAFPGAYNECQPSLATCCLQKTVLEWKVSDVLQLSSFTRYLAKCLYLNFRHLTPSLWLPDPDTPRSFSTLNR